MALPSLSDQVRPPLAAANDLVVRDGLDEEVGLRDILDMLLRGKWVLTAAVLSFLIPAVIYSWSQPSRYRSTATVIIQKEAGSLVGVVPGANEFFQSKENLENEILVLRQSLALAEAAAIGLVRMERAPGSDAPLSILRRLKDGSVPTTRDVALRLQGEYVTVEPDPSGATAVNIAATSTDPTEAALIANAYSEAFVALSLGQSKAGFAQSRSFLEERLEDQEEELLRRDSDVQAFMEREGAVALNDETSRVASEVGQLDGEIGAVDVEVQALRARFAALQSELRRLEPLLSERLGSGLDVELTAAQEQAQKLEDDLEKIYVRTPAYRTAPSSADPELARLRTELDRAQGRVRDISARLARQAIASGSGPGEQASGFTRAAELRTEIADAEIALSQAQGRRSQLASQLAQAEAELGEIPSQAIQLAQLQRAREGAEQLYGALKANYQEAQVAEQSQIGTGRVIRPAFVDPDPVGPNRLRNVLLALGLGLGVGGLIAVAKVRLDHRIHVPDDLTSKGYPLLGTIPDTNDLIAKDFGGEATAVVGGREIDTHIVALLNPMATASESYRSLRTSVQFSRPDVVVQTVLVTSANPSEGKSTTTANLGVVMAQSGRRVLMVDADLRKPTAHRKFGLPREPGLVQVLFEDVPFDPASIPAVADDLYVLTAGSTVPNPSELIGSRRMREVIEQMRGSFDVILFDAPPVLAATDAVLLSTQCDATLVVCKAGSTKDFELGEAHEALESVGASVIGTVLNGFDVSNAYGYKYKYAYRYGSDYAYGADAST